MSDKKSTSSVERRRSGAGTAPGIDYTRLFTAAADAILVVSAEGRYIDANPAACALTGYSRDELCSMRVGDLAIPEERSLAHERFKLLRETGRTRSDRTLLTKDGRRILVETSAAAVGGGAFQATVRDISARVATERQATQSVEAYSALIDLCHAAVVSADAEGHITSWNPAAQAVFGYDQSEAVGMPVTELIPQRLRQQHLSAFSRRVRGGDAPSFTRTLQTHGLHKSGSEFPIEVAVTVWKQGGCPIMTAQIRDLSEQRDVLERLNDALQRLQFHVERMPLAYIVWGEDFRVLEWNPAAETIFGYTKQEASGRHAYDLIVPPDVRGKVDKVWHDLLHGDTSSHAVNANVRKDGTRVTCEWFNTPLRDSSGCIHGVASMAMDVSEREAMEEQIRHAQKLESLGVLAGGVAHDFNSFLTVILGRTALIRSMKNLPLPVTEHLDVIEATGTRAHDLIKHLLAYARTGRHNPQPLDLNKVIRDVSSFIQASIGEAHQLKPSLAARLPMIQADSGQIEQIILNLCLNARDAMPDGGAIAVSTRRVTLTATRAARCVPHNAKPGVYVELLVRDTGSGMDEATRARIFDPFFTTKPTGHGLGLAAALGIMRQHGAVALVESKLGRGTSIHVYFPAVESNADNPITRRKSSVE